MRSLCFVVLLWLIPAALHAQYLCNTVACQLPDCHCADTAPPGRLAPADVPQFILVTFDDAVHTFSEQLIGAFLTDLRNPNGQLAPATYFINEDHTIPELVQHLYTAGHEIANHTATHTTGNETDAGTWQWEIDRLETFVIDSLGIPADQLRGFRAPYLATNQEMWDELARQNYLYDSSVPEQVMNPPLVSTGLDAYVWPHTLDYGIGLSCLANACPVRPIPGLWTIPMWVWYDQNGGLQGAMDPATTSADLFAEVLDYTFEARYHGNRVPLSLYLHAGQTAYPGRPVALRTFLEEKLSLPDVWMVTMRGLIEWMRAPVPASEIADWFADNCHRGYCRPAATDTEPAAPTVPRLYTTAYPNPTNGDAILDLTPADTGPIDLEVIDLLGRVVHRSRHTLPQRLTLPLARQPYGTYFYRLHDQHGLLTQGRIVRAP